MKHDTRSRPESQGGSWHTCALTQLGNGTTVPVPPPSTLSWAICIAALMAACGDGSNGGNSDVAATCPAPLSECGGVCTNMDHDADNCGSCGNDALTSLGPLLRIQDNPLMPTCEAEAVRARLVAAGWSEEVSISGNNATCP